MFVLWLVLLVQALRFSTASNVGNEELQLPTLYAMDDYKSCLQSSDDLYCLVRAKIVGGRNDKMISSIQNYSKAHTHFDYSYIERGLCVKKSCERYTPASADSLDLKAMLQECVNDKLSKQYDVNTALFDDYYCDRAEESRTLSTSAWAVISIIGAIVALNIVGTICHVYNIKGKHLFIEAFSVPFHWTRLSTRSIEYENSRNGFLMGLDGIRGILLFVTILPHNAIVFSVFTNNPEDFEQAPNRSVIIKFLAGALSVVQIHFAMSGFLCAYNLEIQSEKQRLTLKHFPLLFMYRLLRLIPLYILVLLMTVHLFPLMGSGPLWKTFAVSMSADCSKYFWHHMFFVNNYMTNDQCLIQTWHIAADTQVFLVGLLVYLATPPRHRQRALCGLLLLGLAIPATIIWMNGYKGVAIITPELFRKLFTVSFRMFHVKGHNNIACFTAGMLAGMLAYKWRLNPDSNPPLGITFWKAYLWLTVPAFVAIYTSVQWFQFDSVPAAVATRVAFCVVFLLAQALASMLMFLSFATKAQGGFRPLLEWRGWRLAGGTSYAAYLLHMHLIYYWISTRKQLADVTLANFLTMQCSVYVLSMLVAIPFNVLVEAPMNIIVKRFTNSLIGKPKKKKQ